jgi:glycosyltransferase involved in cell wall biosynthesis
MKLACIHSFLDQLRGAEKAFSNMVIALKDRKHDIDVYTFNIIDYFYKKFLNKNINVLNLNFKVNPEGRKLELIRRTYCLYLFPKLAKIINKNDYDLIFVHHYSTSPIIPLLKFPKVYYCQEPVRMTNEPTPFLLKIFYLPYGFIDKISVKKADLILTNSDYTREYIWKVYEVFSITNYLGIDTTTFKRLDIEKESVILSVGALYPFKAHDFVLRALKFIPTKKRPRLIVVGSGSKKYEDEIKKLATHLGICLEIRKNVSDAELVELYNRAKLTCVTSIMEPFGLTALESMACETPVLGIREGGLRETVLDGETGILTNRDEKEFASAMEYILENDKEAKLMGKKGRRRVEQNFTWEICARNLEKNFKKVIETI